MQTIRQSLDYAVANKHGYVGIEHFLFVLTAPNSSVAVTKTSDLAASCARIRELVSERLEPGDGDGSRNVPQTPEAKQILLDAMQIAESLGHVGVNPEHMFLALLDIDSESLVAQIAADAMIDMDRMRAQLESASEFDRYTLPVPTKADGKWGKDRHL